MVNKVYRTEAEEVDYSVIKPLVTSLITSLQSFLPVGEIDINHKDENDEVYKEFINSENEETQDEEGETAEQYLVNRDFNIPLVFTFENKAAEAFLEEHGLYIKCTNYEIFYNNNDNLL